MPRPPRRRTPPTSSPTRRVQAIDERAPARSAVLPLRRLPGPARRRPRGDARRRCAGHGQTGDPPTPALLDDEPLPQPPNFNEADVSDKPRSIAKLAPLTPAQIVRATRNYRCRGESLLAIDDSVERIVERAAGRRGAREHADHLHLRQRVLPRRAPDRRRQEPGVRGGDPGAAADARTRDPPRRRGQRRGDQRRPRTDRHRRRERHDRLPARRPLAAPVHRAPRSHARSRAADRAGHPGG